MRSWAMMGVLMLMVSMVGCISPYKQSNGLYIKPVQVEIRSPFGTNQSGMKLERCEGPAKSVWYYTEGDFKNCVLLTKADQDEWLYGYSRGSGPEIAGAAIMGGSIGIGAALSGVNASAGAAATATNTAVQTVTHGRGHRR